MGGVWVGLPICRPQIRVRTQSAELSSDLQFLARRRVFRSQNDAMDNVMRISKMREKLLFTDQLLASGMTERRLFGEVREGWLVRVIHGCYMERQEWEELYPEELLLARSLAVARKNMGRTLVFSRFSAAAIWGIPLFRYQPGPVHVLTPRNARGRTSTSVTRHSDPWCDEEVVEIAGLLVTDVSKTLVDLARHASSELAVGAADAGLRMMFGPGRNGVPSEVSEWRGSQLEMLAAMRGGRGVRKASRVLEFADQRADSVVESVSRLQFSRLQMDVEIQVPVRGSEGQQYWLDFEFIGQRAFGEVDGAVKYADTKMLRGQTADRVVLIEKRREDDIRGVENKRIVRWMPDVVSNPESLGRRMRAFGLRVPAME